MNIIPFKYSNTGGFDGKIKAMWQPTRTTSNETDGPREVVNGLGQRRARTKYFTDSSKRPYLNFKKSCMICPKITVDQNFESVIELKLSV